MCGLAAFANKVTHALRVGLGDRPPAVSVEGCLDASHTRWRRAIRNVYRTIRTAVGAYGSRARLFISYRQQHLHDSAAAVDCAPRLRHAMVTLV